MKIGIGKIGQKLIFDRTSPEATRSSTNGNASVWSFYDMLIKTRTNDEFYMLGDYDCLPYKNLHDSSEIDLKKLDGAIIFCGILDDEKMIDKINNNNIKYVLIEDDLRCLDSLSTNARLTQLPYKIIGQDDRIIVFQNKVYHMEYIPVERSHVYQMGICKYAKKKDMTILANYSNVYPRLDIVKKMTAQSNIPIYGRLNKDTKYPPRFKGEIGYQESIQKLRDSRLTFIVPVDKRVVTTKYVEALCCGCVPLFWCDYDTQALNIPLDLIIYSQANFRYMTTQLLKHWGLQFEYWSDLSRNLLEPYKSGVKLSNEVIGELKS